MCDVIGLLSLIEIDKIPNWEKRNMIPGNLMIVVRYI